MTNIIYISVVGSLYCIKLIFIRIKLVNSLLRNICQNYLLNMIKIVELKLNIIRDYIKLLKQFGLSLGEPYIKHIEDDLWELRPIRDRIFFMVWHDNSFILLHHFLKKSQKTPRKEIEAAKRKINDLKSRG